MENLEDRPVILGLNDENRTLKLQLLDARTHIQQLELGTLIVNARLVVLRFGKPTDPYFESPVEREDRPLSFNDGVVSIISSKVTRALDIRVAGEAAPIVRIAWDGSIESLNLEFGGIRNHIRDIETKVKLDHKAT